MKYLNLLFICTFACAQENISDYTVPKYRIDYPGFNVKNVVYFVKNATECSKVCDQLDASGATCVGFVFYNMSYNITISGVAPTTLIPRGTCAAKEYMGVELQSELEIFSYKSLRSGGASRLSASYMLFLTLLLLCFEKNVA